MQATKVSLKQKFQKLETPDWCEKKTNVQTEDLRI